MQQINYLNRYSNLLSIIIYPNYIDKLFIMGGGGSKPKPRGPPRELVAKNEYLKKQLASLNSTLRRIQRNINTINYRIRNKQNRIVLMEKEIKNLKKSTQGYTHRYNSAKSLIRQYNSEIKTLQGEKRKLDKEIKDLKKEISSLIEIISQVDNGNIDLEYELDMLLEEHNKVKGLSVDNNEKYYDLLTVQNSHLNREFDYLKNDLTKGDQASTFVQPKMRNWELAHHFLKISYYVFALVLLLFLYQYFSMDKLYTTIIIILLIGLYPFYIIHIERFIYENVLYIGKFLTANPVK
jgi:chromosome segregation ATPase